ncbi:MAG: hypothetical protein AAFP90_15220, partial [Planctomycetota bacterium]
LFDPTALLINRSPGGIPPLALDLVATQNGRSATGAVITVQSADVAVDSKPKHHFVFAGDGYACRDQPTQFIPWPSGRSRDERANGELNLKIRWPSGTTTQHTIPKTGHYKIIQNVKKPFQQSIATDVADRERDETR